MALNKPSYQVSTYGAHNASLANDGIVNTCVRSQSETNPWWAVDLGVETLVAQVNLINSRYDAGRDFHFAVYYLLLCVYFINLWPLCYIRPTSRTGIHCSRSWQLFWFGLVHGVTVSRWENRDLLFHHYTLSTKYALIFVETCPPDNGIVSLVRSGLDFSNATFTGVTAYLLRQLQLLTQPLAWHSHSRRRSTTSARCSADFTGRMLLSGSPTRSLF